MLPELERGWPMNTQALEHSTHTERLVRFLDEHPGLSPLLTGEDAVVYGFEAGAWFLSLADMELLIVAPPSPWLALLADASL
jgi:hypothetical protein